MRSIRCISVGIALLQCVGAFAGTIPIQLDITDGENAQQLVIDAPLIYDEPNGIAFEASGSTSSATWRLDWRFSGGEALVTDPQLGLMKGFAGFDLQYKLQNSSSDTRGYSIRAAIPIQTKAEFAEYRGSMSPAVTDLNGDGAFLTGNPDASSTFYLSLIDGAPFVGLLGAASKTSAGPFETGSFTTPGGSGFGFPCPTCDLWRSGPPVQTELGIQMAVSITSQDQGLFHGNFFKRTVPEPSGLGIAGIIVSLTGCLTLVRRSRK